jgi:hypothetical protein
MGSNYREMAGRSPETQNEKGRRTPPFAKMASETLAIRQKGRGRSIPGLCLRFIA